MKNIGFKRFFLFLFVATISTFSLFAAGFSKTNSNSVTKAQWDAAFSNIDNASCKYSLAVVVDNISLGNINGVFKFAPEKLAVSANVALSSTVEMGIKEQFGEGFSGLYNAYLGYSKNSDKLNISKLCYTEKNSTKYIDISDKKEIVDTVSTVISSYANILDSDIGKYDNFSYKNGKYVGDVKINNYGVDLNAKVSYAFSNGNLTSIDAVVDTDVPNPLNGQISHVNYTLSGYIYDQGATKINF